MVLIARLGITYNKLRKFNFIAELPEENHGFDCFEKGDLEQDEYSERYFDSTSTILDHSATKKNG